MSVIRLEQQSTGKKTTKLYDFIASSIFCAFMLFFVFGAVRWWKMLLLGSVLAGVYSFVFTLISEKVKPAISTSMMGAGFLFCFALLSRQIISGITIYLNELINNWNIRKGTIYQLFVSQTEDSRVIRAIIVVLIALLIAALINTAVYYKAFVPVLLFLYMGFIYYMLTSAEAKGYMIFIMTAVALVVLSYSASHSGSDRTRIIFPVIIAASVLVIAGTSYLLCRKIPTSRLDTYREKTLKYIETKIYGVSDLPEGRLAESGPKQLGDEPRLSVEAEEEGLMYLKGYTGCAYNDGNWQELDKEAYSDTNKDLLQYMIEKKDTSLTLLGSFLTISNNFYEGTYKFDEETLKVKNIGASDKYIYTPYFCIKESFELYDNVYKDQCVMNPVSDIKKEYKFVCGNTDENQMVSLYDNGVLNDIMNRAAYGMNDIEVKHYALEQAYRNYVDEYYTVIPDEVRSTLDAEAEPLSTDIGVELITDSIRAYVKENITSDYSPDYASKATLMYRYYGVPARYVEGYRCELKEGQNTITAKSAHAWVEVYRYGMGWVPIDVTPGFYEDEESIAEMSPESGYDNANDSDQSQSDEDKDLEAEKSGGKLKKIMLFILLFVMIIFMVVIIRMIVIDNQIKKKINGENLNDAVLFMAGRIWYILGKTGLSVDRGLPVRYASQIDKTLEDSSLPHYRSIDDIFMKARYSGKDIQQPDYEVVKNYYEVLSGTVSGRLSAVKKLMWRLIYVIY